MLHSFSVLNFATCDWNKLASVPNHGSQTVTCVPRSASLLTLIVLAAGSGVFWSDGFSLAFERGVPVPKTLGTGLPQAEMAKRTVTHIRQSFREDAMLVRHHGDGSEDQEKDQEDKKTKG